MAFTVLVVDDSPTMVMSLKTTLVMSGFQVETAGNGRAALDKLQTGRGRPESGDPTPADSETSCHGSRTPSASDGAVPARCISHDGGCIGTLQDVFRDVRNVVSGDTGIGDQMVELERSAQGRFGDVGFRRVEL